jgi:branched-chain amino acid transport system permease protein
MKSLVTLKEGSAGHWALRMLATVIVVGIMLYIPTSGNNGLITSATEAFTLMIAAMALNLILGYAGQISIGHSAFFGIGAYTTGILVSKYEWSPWFTFFAAFVIAFVVGVVVSFPASRIKGVYLALVTLALALVFPNLLRWPKLESLTGGSTGVPTKDAAVDTTGFNIGRRGMRNFEIFGWDPFGDLRGQGAIPFYYWIAAGTAIIVYLACRGVVKSRAGRSLVAVRDNETAAAVMGVNLVAAKAFAFGISAGLCALGGSVTAIRLGQVTPDILNLTILGSLTFLIIMVIGGAGSLWGPVIGAALYVFVTDRTGTWADDDKIPGLLKPFFAWAKVPPGTGIFAVILIVLMFVAPRGIVGMWKQYSPRVVRIVPRPAGATAAPPPALVASDASASTDTPEGESE